VNPCHAKAEIATTNTLGYVSKKDDVIELERDSHESPQKKKDREQQES